MKKKYRDITVDDVKYAWKVKTDDDCNYLVIWKDKKIIYQGDITADVTPSYVSSIIKSL